MAAFIARRALSVLKFASTQRCVASIQNQKRQISFTKYLGSTRRFTEKHEWILLENTVGTIGISNHAQDQLGEIVYVESPEIGTHLEVGDVSGCLESVKAASDIYSPVAGEVAEVNEKLSTQPNLVNESPMEEGWLYKLKVDAGTDISDLMDEAAYEKFVQQSEH